MYMDCMWCVDEVHGWECCSESADSGLGFGLGFFFCLVGF